MLAAWYELAAKVSSNITFYSRTLLRKDARLMVNLASIFYSAASHFTLAAPGNVDSLRDNFKLLEILCFTRWRHRPTTSSLFPTKFPYMSSCTRFMAHKMQ